eukprot:693912-Pelagomonas_calceolata.AAC.2
MDNPLLLRAQTHGVNMMLCRLLAWHSIQSVFISVCILQQLYGLEDCCSPEFVRCAEPFSQHWAHEDAQVEEGLHLSHLDLKLHHIPTGRCTHKACSWVQFTQKCAPIGCAQLSGHGWLIQVRIIPVLLHQNQGPSVSNTFKFNTLPWLSASLHKSPNHYGTYT